MLKNIFLRYIRSIIFGLEDSLVSTLGAVTGIAIGTYNQFIIILSGIVIIFVEALSMTAGQYLSAKSAKEVLELGQKNGNHFKGGEFREKPVVSAAIMAAAYLAGGIIPVLPYFALSIGNAIIVSIAITSLALFAVGAFKGAVLGTGWFRSGFEMLLISGLAALMGFFISKAVSYLYGIVV